uniref:Protein NrdI n=1 Tax=Providencia stuartii TaxID=588 RepID=A0AAI9DBV0_PROST|nr:class Ib ribonucleoside-diphosphate reductase assembly flavoprotein NrdI [Providencia stuartii]
MQTESLVYFSSRSGNCHRFIKKVGLPATRLPIGEQQNSIIATKPFVLLLPTYGGGGSKGAVPKEVIRFLNIESNRQLIRGVIAAGNTNFGDAFAIAGDIIAHKCQVPYLYRFELLGTERDVQRVRDGLNAFWQQKHH